MGIIYQLSIAAFPGIPSRRRPVFGTDPGFPDIPSRQNGIFGTNLHVPPTSGTDPPEVTGEWGLAAVFSRRGRE